MSILDPFYSLGRSINKLKGRENDMENEEGIVSEKLPELELSMSNEDLIKLTEKWEKKWIDSDVYDEFKEAGDENERYWKGKHYQQPKGNKERAIVDNVIFEALETYLPQVTRRNPDPMVTLSRKEEQSKENLAYASEVQKNLAELGDELVLRLKLKKSCRHWAIYLLGSVKVGWDIVTNQPTLRVIRPRKMILDPEATIDEDGYSGEYLGEYRRLTISQLKSILKDIGEKEGIEELNKISDKKTDGTEIQFKEWWTKEYLCWTLNSVVLLKAKNPNWNYATDEPAPYDEYGKPPVNEDGTPQMVQQRGFNHFAEPQIPYIFLSVFNLGKQPVDETSLIGQNLANQDMINKRNRQIDKNIDSMNGGMIVSLGNAGLSKNQAYTVSEALRKGGTVTIPAGRIDDAIKRDSAPSLPADVYHERDDKRIRLRDIFGIRGSSAAGLDTEKTVRGKYQNKILDTDRIGGGISEYLEQMADKIYNWFVQLMYVHDETMAGQPHPKIIISVKEGSLLPKDSMTIANQAIELSAAGKMSMIDLYKSLDYPNPEEMAANVWLEANAPDILFANDPRIQQVVQGQQQAAQAQAQAQAQAEMQKEQQKHDNDMAKEEFKAKVDIEKEIIDAETQNNNKPNK